MDNFKLQQEVQALKQLADHYENQLKIIGLEPADLPDDVTALLDDCVELQRATNLHDLNLNYLKEFYYNKKKQRIEQNAIIAKQQAELQQLSQEIVENERELETLEKFTTAVNKRLVSDAELQRSKLTCVGKTQGLLNRQAALKLPEDFKIDELIKKIELLQRSNTKDKP